MSKRRYEDSSLYWSDVPGLSQLDVQLSVRRKTPDSEAISVSNAELLNIRVELICPICLDIMENVMVTKCLHRYCRDCIHKHLRQVDVKRECPSCRINLNTNRSLRKDDAMDAVVNLFFANRAPRSRDDDTVSRPSDRNIARESARRHREQILAMREKQRRWKENSANVIDLSDGIPQNTSTTIKQEVPNMKNESATIRAPQIECADKSGMRMLQRDGEIVGLIPGTIGGIEVTLPAPV